ncbi:MAG: 4-(cytidine 5'-diphospho)-2-C-methyl-D-erythritol kinase [Bacteroidetes bacterium]|nr:4-(cytidine 5'-diphospho)-2-C-methyl-D-erythritol kinase [Bacteroidota bacterium]
MIAFPNCKINLGLNVLSKRPDGFHNINTVFYPINWCDILEVVEKQSDKPLTLSVTGKEIQGKTEDNLLYKTWKIISGLKKLPPLHIHLHKVIPMGAGIGGGSSDAAFLVRLLDKKFSLELSYEEKHGIASQLGSDCAFFLSKNPLYAIGRGNDFTPVTVDLSKYYILVVFPSVHSSTKEAFDGLTPKKPMHDLKHIIETAPLSEWKNLVINDFDVTVMKKYPAIKELKDQLYKAGAVYSSMSGSGSSVYAIFNKKPELIFPSNYDFYLQLPTS